jgi:hypothetical protein
MLVSDTKIADSMGKGTIFLVNLCRPYLVEAEDAIQDAEHMFHFGAYSRLSCVLSLAFFIGIILKLRPAAGHVLRVRHSLVDRFRLALIGFSSARATRLWS